MTCPCGHAMTPAPDPFTDDVRYRCEACGRTVDEIYGTRMSEYLRRRQFGALPEPQPVVVVIDKGRRREAA